MGWNLCQNLNFQLVAMVYVHCEWSDNQECPWQGRCKFAHGYDELRSSKATTPNTIKSPTCTCTAPVPPPATAGGEEIVSTTTVTTPNEMYQELELLRAENKYLRLQVKFYKSKLGIHREESEKTAGHPTERRECNGSNGQSRSKSKKITVIVNGDGHEQAMANLESHHHHNDAMTGNSRTVQNDSTKNVVKLET